MVIFLALIVCLLVWGTARSLPLGCAIALSIRLLIPPCARIFNVSLNTFCVLILLLFFVFRILKHDYKVRYCDIFPVTKLAFPLIALSFFAPLAFNIQMSYMTQFIVTEIVFSCILAVVVREKEEFDAIMRVLVVSYCVVGAYGILTYFLHGNPVYTLFANSFGSDVNYTGDGTVNMRGALSGFASGNLSGPLPWGQASLVIFSLLLCCYPFDAGSSIRNGGVIVLAFCNCFLSGKRSIILPALILLFIFFLMRVAFKKKVIFFFLAIPMAIIFMGNSTIQDVFSRNVKTSILIWDDGLASSSGVSGSSKALRAEQLQYCLGMIEHVPIQGLGYGYSENYRDTKGKHPVMLGFESLIFQILTNSGFLGLLVWVIFLFSCYRYTSGGVVFSTGDVLLHGGYFLSLVLTGIQASFYLYLIVVILVEKRNRFIGLRSLSAEEVVL